MPTTSNTRPTMNRSSIAPSLLLAGAGPASQLDRFRASSKLDNLRSKRSSASYVDRAREKIGPIQAKIKARGFDKGKESHRPVALDLGILPGVGGNWKLDNEGCPGESVVCDGGMAGTETCAEACDEMCCKGTDSCVGFTGTVCKDGLSCGGDLACFNAAIGLVIRGCQDAGACAYAASYYYPGSIDVVEDSCIGQYSCFKAASIGGSLGVVSNSCTEAYSCRSSAYGFGNIPEITNSCTATRACAYISFAYGGIGALRDSCNDYRSCEFATFNGGQINEISGSCNGTLSCYGVAEDLGVVGPIHGSCIGDQSCFYAGQNSSYVGRIESSCRGEFACIYAAEHYGYSSMSNSCNGTASCALSARYGGRITQIVGSCGAEEACYRAGYSGNINGIGIENSCNNIRACAGAGEDCDVPSGITSCCNEQECENKCGEVCGAVEPSTDPPTMPPTAKPTTKRPTTSKPSMTPSSQGGKAAKSKSSKAESKAEKQEDVVRKRTRQHTSRARSTG